MKSELLFTETSGTRVTQYRKKNPLRIELVESKPTIGQNIWLSLLNFFKEILLPYGYPDLVSSDYFEYQVWDTLQAFCSTITGSFTTRAILKGVGVGNASASALSATITWIMKDGSGMIGRIFFAWWKGSMLDCDCKKWRLFADFLNDLAMAVELGIPFYSHRSMEILCLTSMMKSVVGIAGGATRASITHHQAKQGNMAEISAKDGTQETVVNLIASFTSLYLLGKIFNPMYELPFIFVMMVLHLYFNFKAVNCLIFDTLNDSRMVLVLTEYYKNNSLNLALINSKESVILGSGSNVSDICDFKIKLGSSLKRVVELYNFKEMEQLLQLYDSKPYLIVSDVEKKQIYIALDEKCESRDILHGYVYAVMLSMATCLYNNIPLKVQVIRKRNYTNFVARLETFMKSIRNNSDHPKNMSPTELKNFNEFVEPEIAMFLVTLDVHKWKTDFHSLTMEQWKANRKFYSEKIE